MMLICRSNYFERNVQQHDALTKYPVSFAGLAVQITMSINKRNTLTAQPDEMCEQFKGRIICGRCGNSEWTAFMYMLPMDGRGLVQCLHCGLTFFKSIEPSQNNTVHK